MESDNNIVYCVYFRTIPKKAKGDNSTMLSPFKIQALILPLRCLTIGQNLSSLQDQSLILFPCLATLKRYKTELLICHFADV